MPVQTRDSKKNATEIFATEYVRANHAYLKQHAAQITAQAAAGQTAAPEAQPLDFFQTIPLPVLLGGGALLLFVILR